MVVYELGSVDPKFKEKLEGFKLTFNSVNLDEFIKLNCDEIEVVKYLIKQTFEIDDDTDLTVAKTDKPGIYNVCLNSMTYEIEIKIEPTEEE